MKDTVLDPWFLREAAIFLSAEYDSIKDKLYEPHMLLAEPDFVEAVETIARIAESKRRNGK